MNDQEKQRLKNAEYNAEKYEKLWIKASIRLKYALMTDEELEIHYDGELAYAGPKSDPVTIIRAEQKRRKGDLKWLKKRVLI